MRLWFVICGFLWGQWVTRFANFSSEIYDVFAQIFRSALRLTANHVIHSYRTCASLSKRMQCFSVLLFTQNTPIRKLSVSASTAVNSSAFLCDNTILLYNKRWATVADGDIDSSSFNFPTAARLVNYSSCFHYCPPSACFVCATKVLCGFLFTECF